MKKAHGLGIAKAILGAHWARDHADDKKPILAAALEIAFDPAANIACIGLDRAARDSAAAWLPPGFDYVEGIASGAQEPAAEEAAATEDDQRIEEPIEDDDLPAFLTDDEPRHAVPNGAAVS